MQYELQIKNVTIKNTEITLFENMFHVACFISLMSMVLAISIYYKDKCNHMTFQLSMILQLSKSHYYVPVPNRRGH